MQEEPSTWAERQMAEAGEPTTFNTTISGEVVLPNGAPAHGAAVAVTYRACFQGLESSCDANSPDCENRDTLSDAQGQFSVPLNVAMRTRQILSVVVVAKLSGYAPSRKCRLLTKVGETAEPVQLELFGVGSVCGRVVFPGGNSAAQARITVTTMNSSSWKQQENLTADAAGFFILHGVPAAPCHVSAEIDGRARGSGVCLIRQGEVFELPQPIVLGKRYYYLRIHDETGAPIAGPFIAEFASDDGIFQLEGHIDCMLPDDPESNETSVCDNRIRLEYFKPGNWQVVVWKFGYKLGPAVSFSLGEDFPADGLEIRLTCEPAPAGK